MTSPDPRLLAAIAAKRLVSLRFKEKARVAEPHDYGLHNGRETLFAYQLSPEAGWRWFEVARIADLEVLDRRFAGGRPSPSGKHHRWDVVFARVASSR